MKLMAVFAIAALAGCAPPGLKVSREGNFEVGRLPGDIVGAYAALTSNAGKDLFGQVCVMKSCVWTLVLQKDDCADKQTVQAIVSIDGKASTQELTCGGKGSYLVGEMGKESALTASILDSRQVGVTLPSGRAAVFETAGVRAATTQLADRIR